MSNLEMQAIIRWQETGVWESTVYPNRCCSPGNYPEPSEIRNLFTKAEGVRI